MKLQNHKNDELKGRLKTFLFLVFTITYACAFTTCASNKSEPMLHNKTPDQKSKNGLSIISCEIVTRQFVTKNGQQADKKEYYLRRSIQDYFIKFCESEISQLELEQHLELVKDDFIKMVTVEVEFKKGLWDDCDKGEEVESRVGDYVTLSKVL